MYHVYKTSFGDDNRKAERRLQGAAGYGTAAGGEDYFTAQTGGWQPDLCDYG